MRDKNMVTVGALLIQIARGMENPTDTIKSFGTWCGVDAPAKYTVYVKREDGTEYEINIQADDVLFGKE